MPWHGPFEVYTGAPGIGCPGGGTPAYAGGTSPGVPPTCSQCGCTPPTNASCNEVSVNVSTSQTCNGAPCGTLLLSSGCSLLPTSPTCATAVAPLSFSVTATGVGGPCTPTVQAAQPPAKFATGVAACAPPPNSSTCGTGGVCLPDPPAGSTVQVCIVQAGPQTCPAGLYTVQKVVYTTFTDTRACGDCGCGTTAVKCTGGTVTLSPTLGCNPGMSAPLPVPCSTIPGVPLSPFYAQLTALPTPTAACSPSGGAPSGSATPSGALTFCCK